MRVAEMLELNLLRDAGLAVVCGDERATDAVRWVHSGEIIDIARFLTGGEVLLTAATGLGAPGADPRRYVRELAAAGATAVIIELGRTFAELPDDMVDEARGRGLMLATLDREVPFAAVTQQVHTAILAEQHEVQERAQEIGDAFSQLVLDGASISEMLSLLAERLGNPVLLEDGMRRVVAYGSGARSISPILRHWPRHSRSGHRGSAVGVQAVDGDPSCVWTSVALRGELWGRLHVLELDAPIDAVTRLALGRAASNVALYLLSERESFLSESAERSLVGDAMSVEDFSGQAFIDRACGLGVRFDEDLVVLVVSRPTRSADGDAAPDILQEESWIRDWIRAAGWPGVVGHGEDRIVVVASTPSSVASRERLESLTEALAASGYGYRIGVSRPTAPPLLPRAHAEARTAHDLGPSVSQDAIQFYDDLVLHRLLAPLARSGPQLANFVESELGDIIAYDVAHQSDLLATLDAFLESNGNKVATADALFLQRRSIYYRLTRIEELLGRSLESADHRVRLSVALRAREVLEVAGANPSF